MMREAFSLALDDYFPPRWPPPVSSPAVSSPKELGEAIQRLNSYGVTWTLRRMPSGFECTVGLDLQGVTAWSKTLIEALTEGTALYRNRVGAE